MKKILIILLIITTSCNSNQQKEDLELIILNKNLKSYCADNNCTPTVMYSKNNYEKYYKKSNNILKFKIVNNSKNNYLISTYCVNQYCSEEESFPNKRFGLDLHNLQIMDEVSREVVTVGFSFVTTIPGLPSFIDSLYIKNYNKNGYYNEKWIRKNIYLSEKFIKIPSGKTAFFETHVNIPFNKPSLGSLQTVKLSKKNKYSVSMIFNIDSTDIRGYLTWSQQKNLEENDYQIYHGTIKSNTVPLIFVE